MYSNYILLYVNSGVCMKCSYLEGLTSVKIANFNSFIVFICSGAIKTGQCDIGIGAG